jgi:tripeptide aminopeptidase
MVNAVHLAGRLLAALPREHSAPETTDGRQGYIHPHDIEGNAAKVVVRFILRDFDNDKLAQHGARLKALCEGLQGAEPRARLTCEIKPSYRNMGYWLKNDMRPVDYAFEAVRAVGLQPMERAIRGGTDGSRLTERGLPTPNIFDGCHNAHGPLEWVCVQDMEAAVRVCAKLVEIWEQRS